LARLTPASSIRSDPVFALNDPTLAAYHLNFQATFERVLRERHFDADAVAAEPIPMSLLNFSSLWDKATGLGITIHQVWRAKAELENFRIKHTTSHGHADLVYTLYDHCGLDWEDIVKHGGDRLPWYHTGDFFKAWYIQQHYRSARPFITVMTRRVFIAGGLR
jgi:hypothetical protein